MILWIWVIIFFLFLLISVFVLLWWTLTWYWYFHESMKRIKCLSLYFVPFFHSFLFLMMWMVVTSVLVIRSALFLSRSPKVYLVLLFFHFRLYSESESLSYFFLYFSNFFFGSSLMDFNAMLIFSWMDERCRMFGSLLFFSLYDYNLGFSQLMFLVLL